MDYIPSIATQRAKQCSIAVHDDKAELLVRLKELTQGLGMKLVVTEVQRCVDGLERLEINVDLSRLAF